MATKSPDTEPAPNFPYLRYICQGDKWIIWILAAIGFLIACICKYGIIGGWAGNLLFLAMLTLALTWSIKGWKAQRK